VAFEVTSASADASQNRDEARVSVLCQWQDLNRDQRGTPASGAWAGGGVPLDILAGCPHAGHVDVTLRHARPQDAIAIASVHVASWQMAYGGLLPAEFLASLSAAARARTWTEILERTPKREATILVAEVNGVIIGFAAVTRTTDGEPEPGTGALRSLYVEPAFWGTGAGRALHDRALISLVELGVAQATLWVLDDNRRARRFYERRGWSADGGLRTEWEANVRLDETRYRITL